MCLAIDHRIAVDSPGLSAGPCRTVGIPLVCHAFDKMAVEWIIDSHMITRTVGTEMMVHCCLGMLHGNIVERFVATVFRSPEEHFEIDHVVHDSIVTSEHFHISRPRQNSADIRIEKRGKRIGAGEKHLLVAAVGSQTISVAVAAYHQKAEIMIEDRSFRQIAELTGIAQSLVTYKRIAGKLIVVPQYTRPEARTPFIRCSLSAGPCRVVALDIARYHRVVGRVAAEIPETAVNLCVAVFYGLVEVELSNLLPGCRRCRCTRGKHQRNQ